MATGWWLVEGTVIDSGAGWGQEDTGELTEQFMPLCRGE